MTYQDVITGEDAKAIMVCASALRHLSGRHYDPADLPDERRPLGLQDHRTQAERAEAVAAKIDRRRVI